MQELFFFSSFFLGGGWIFSRHAYSSIHQSLSHQGLLISKKKNLTYKPAAKIIHQFQQLVTLSWQYIISQTQEWNTQYNEKRLSCAPLTSHKISIFLSAWQEFEYSTSFLSCNQPFTELSYINMLLSSTHKFIFKFAFHFHDGANEFRVSLLCIHIMYKTTHSVVYQ